MNTGLSLTFRRFERSGAVEVRIRELGERLRRCDERITQCHISVLGGDAMAAGCGADMSVAVKIHLSLPGAQIHADSEYPDGASHSDVFLALRCAYDSARSQLRWLQQETCASRLLIGRQRNREATREEADTSCGLT